MSKSIPRFSIAAKFTFAEGSVFTAQVRITSCKYKLVSGMTGTASVLVSNESVLQRIVQRITNII